MSDLLTWVWDVYYFIDGVSWLFGVIAVGFIGVVVGLRKLMVYFWPELDTPLNKAIRAAKQGRQGVTPKIDDEVGRDAVN